MTAERFPSQHGHVNVVRVFAVNVRPLPHVTAAFNRWPQVNTGEKPEAQESPRRPSACSSRQKQPATRRDNGGGRGDTGWGRGRCLEVLVEATTAAPPLQLQSMSWMRRQISAVNSEHFEFPPRSFVSTWDTQRHRHHRHSGYHGYCITKKWRDVAQSK